MTSQATFRDDVLAAASSREPDTALQALRSAITWATATLEADEAGNLMALELVMSLDDALEGIPSLAEATSRLVERATPGPDVTEHVATQLATLAAARERVRAARLRLEERSAREDELRRLAREHEAIQARLAELADLERRVVAIPELSEQEQALVRHADAMRTHLESAEADLETSARHVITLSQDRLADLGERVRGLLEQIRATESAHAAEQRLHREAVQRLHDVVERYESLQELREDLAQLSAYADVERGLADVLAEAIGRQVTLEGADVREVAASTRSRLERVDEALARALAEHQRLETTARRVLRYGRPAEEEAAR